MAVELVCRRCGDRIEYEADNVVDAMIAEGRLTVEEAEAHPQRSVVAVTWRCEACGEENAVP